jgi:hypothetical protein
MGPPCEPYFPWLFADLDDEELAHDKDARQLATALTISLVSAAQLPFSDDATTVIRRFADRLAGKNVMVDRQEALSDRRRRFLLKRVTAVAQLARTEAEKNQSSQITGDCLEAAIMADIKAVDAERAARAPAA